MSRDRSLLACAETEIVGLHEFFVHWFASPAAADGDFERCELVLDEDFGRIAPNGHFYRRAEMIEQIRTARGLTDASFQIAIEEIAPIWQSGDAILLHYVEIQLRGGSRTRRRSSVLFLRRATAPNGVVWRHLHETWI
jgi:hypothetical protein